MGEEAVPVVAPARLVPGPVGFLGVVEDDGGVFVALVYRRPDVEVAVRRAGRRVAGGLEPGVLVGGVVDDEFDEDLHAALVGGVEEELEIIEGAVVGMDVDVVGDVVAVVAEGRGKEGQEPEAGDAEVLQVIEARDRPGKSPMPSPFESWKARTCNS